MYRSNFSSHANPSDERRRHPLMGLTAGRNDWPTAPQLGPFQQERPANDENATAFRRAHPPSLFHVPRPSMGAFNYQFHSTFPSDHGYYQPIKSVPPPAVSHRTQREPAKIEKLPNSNSNDSNEPPRRSNLGHRDYPSSSSCEGNHVLPPTSAMAIEHTEFSSNCDVQHNPSQQAENEPHQSYNVGQPGKVYPGAGANMNSSSHNCSVANSYEAMNGSLSRDDIPHSIDPSTAEAVEAMMGLVQSSAPNASMTSEFVSQQRQKNRDQRPSLASTLDYHTVVRDLATKVCKLHENQEYLLQKLRTLQQQYDRHVVLFHEELARNEPNAHEAPAPISSPVMIPKGKQPTPIVQRACNWLISRNNSKPQKQKLSKSAEAIRTRRRGPYLKSRRGVDSLSAAAASLDGQVKEAGDDDDVNHVDALPSKVKEIDLTRQQFLSYAAYNTFVEYWIQYAVGSGDKKGEKALRWYEMKYGKEWRGIVTLDGKHKTRRTSIWWCKHLPIYRFIVYKMRHEGMTEDRALMEANVIYSTIPRTRPGRRPFSQVCNAFVQALSTLHADFAAGDDTHDYLPALDDRLQELYGPYDREEAVSSPGAGLNKASTLGEALKKAYAAKNDPEMEEADVSDEITAHV